MSLLKPKPVRIASDNALQQVEIFCGIHQRQKVEPGPALSQCNRCGCIGPRASEGPAPWRLGRLFIFARYSLPPIIVEKLINFIHKNNYLI